MFGDLVRLVKIFELDLDGVDAGDVAVLLEAFFGFLDVLLFFAEEVEFGAVVLEEVGADSVAYDFPISITSVSCNDGGKHTNARTSTSNHVDLPRQVRDVLIRVERIAAEHLGVLPRRIESR